MQGRERGGELGIYIRLSWIFSTALSPLSPCSWARTRLTIRSVHVRFPVEFAGSAAVLAVDVVRSVLNLVISGGGGIC
jgi:hypothetical protein